MDCKIDDDGNIELRASGNIAVQEGGAVLAAHIRARHWQKLSLYIVAVIFILAASLLVVFAPSGREMQTNIIAFSLVIVALGSAGFATFAFKTQDVHIRAGR